MYCGFCSVNLMELLNKNSRQIFLEIRKTNTKERENISKIIIGDRGLCKDLFYLSFYSVLDCVKLKSVVRPFAEWRRG